MGAGWTLATLVASIALAVTGSAQAAMPTTAQTTAVEAGDHAFKQKRYADAIAEYDKVLVADPKNAVALTMRAFARVELRHNETALSDFDAAWKLAPESPNAWANACLGRALANVDLDLALKLCDGAIKADPGNNKDYDTRGFLHLRRGEFDAALKDYVQALHVHRTASSLFGRGLAKIRLGQRAEGEADLAAASKTESEIADTYAKRGMTP